MRTSQSRTTWIAGLVATTFASSATAQLPVEAKPVPAADWVEITLVADEHVSLYAREPRKVTVDDEMGDSWAFVCDAPCGVRVDPRRAYRVMGEGIVPSIHFNLAPGAGRVALQVHPTHPGTHAVGAYLAGTGVVVAVAGALMFVIDAVLNSAATGIGTESTAAGSELSDSATTYRNVGIGLLSGGAVLGAVSLVFLLSGKTDLTPTSVSRPRASADGVRVIPLGFAF